MSDDPDAIEKLKARVERLEKSRDFVKKANAEFRKVKGDVDKMTSISEDEKEIYRMGGQINGRYTAGDTSWDKGFFRGFELTSIGAEIRRNKERLKSLEKMAQMEDREYFVNGVRVVEDTIDNRLKLYFDDIPSVEMRDKLKRWGFRWSRYNKAWQRQLNNNARYSMKQVLND